MALLSMLTEVILEIVLDRGAYYAVWGNMLRADRDSVNRFSAPGARVGL